MRYLLTYLLNRHDRGTVEVLYPTDDLMTLLIKTRDALANVNVSAGESIQITREGEDREYYSYLDKDIWEGAPADALIHFLIRCGIIDLPDLHKYGEPYKAVEI